MTNIAAICFAIYVFVMLGIGVCLQRTVYNLAAPKGHEQDGEVRKLSYLIAIAFFIGALLIGGVLLFDYYGHSMATGKKSDVNNGTPSQLAAEMGGFLGTFGDFFGGVVNPLLTFGTLIALAVTIILQRVQLRDARSEAKQNRQHAHIQTFETTFFHLLNLHTENVKNLNFDPSVVPANPYIIWAFARAELLLPPPQPIVFGRSVFESVLNATAAASSGKLRVRSHKHT